MRGAPRGIWGATLVLLIAVAGLGVVLLSSQIEGQLPKATPAEPTRGREDSSVAVAPTVTEPIVPPQPAPAVDASGPAGFAVEATSQPSRLLLASATPVDASPSPLAPQTAEPTSASRSPGAPGPAAVLARTSESPPTVSVRALPASSPVPPPTSTGVASETSTPEALPTAPYTLRQRLGVAASGHGIDADVAERLGLGWYLDWGANVSAYRSDQVEYVPMIRLRDGVPDPDGQALEEVIAAQPGALWLIGNEPDVKWQDNVPPGVYAQRYHELYHLLKARDPSCKVAIGGITQPSPLRLSYLDRVLGAYLARYGEPIPVDVWNVHSFILREERDSWGVDIPPGMTEQSGLLWEIGDHDSLPIFEEQILNFRRWMKERGQQDKPLIVTEYGILMPNDYGFSPERVEAFMLETFEFFRTAADPALGYPADGFRLVQRWCWYSLADARYPTGNLYQVESGHLTSLGEAFRRFAHSPR